jgi:hypothetical protein
MAIDRKIKVFLDDTELTADTVNPPGFEADMEASPHMPFDLRPHQYQMTVTTKEGTAVFGKPFAPEPTTIELLSGRHWFAERRETTAVLISTKQQGGDVSMQWEGAPGTYKDLTDYGRRARLMRWLYDNSTIFHWAYDRYAAKRGE